MLKQRFRQWWYDERLITVIVLGICIPLMLLAVANSGAKRGQSNGLKLLQRQQQADGTKGAYVFINERGRPFGRMGIGRMVERAGEAARLPFPVHKAAPGRRRTLLRWCEPRPRRCAPAWPLRQDRRLPL